MTRKLKQQSVWFVHLIKKSKVKDNDSMIAMVDVQQVCSHVTKLLLLTKHTTTDHY